jgi:predicted AAA+ superfamily ATPase
MISGVLIIAISVVLLAYWLRYSCVMLLRGAQERSGMRTVADERFNAPSVLKRLKTEADLAPLERALERDYRVVTYLIEHATDLELASIENKLLVFDYQLMRLWSRLTRTLAPQQSRQALSEMASVLRVLVGQMGESNRFQMEA